jgi:hypothetical protein
MNSTHYWEKTAVPGRWTNDAFEPAYVKALADLSNIK